MKYHDLQDLIQNSRSSRAYFLSLSVELQHSLHQYNAHVHSAADLRHAASMVQSYKRLLVLGGWCAERKEPRIS